MTRRNQTKVFTGTAAELRAILDERAPYAKAVYDAMMRGDHDGCAAAQKAMREKFAEAS